MQIYFVVKKKKKKKKEKEKKNVYGRSTQNSYI